MIGGGFVSALSVPLIATLGLTAFTGVAVTITIAMTVWGIRHDSVGRTVPVSD